MDCNFGDMTMQVNLEAGVTPEKIRAHLYKFKADPIFFKWQRGEATEQEWLDMIAKIKSCYPDA